MGICGTKNDQIEQVKKTGQIQINESLVKPTLISNISNISKSICKIEVEIEGKPIIALGFF